MRDNRLIVRKLKGAWAIRCNGRDYDNFPDQQDAVDRARTWSLNARAQGYTAPILVEQDDGTAPALEQ
ncbi:NifB/MoaA-like Fe-S oxidoreductase [Rhodoligotrophos appendicifer]|uniref:hypothetical protein n=1 Tax=Rhodoligotrophos appendicifer TaxID=987056 RepID=UPI0011856A28|nr:hypothetical protein [Rhodoligotrophos appendicifer]